MRCKNITAPDKVTRAVQNRWVSNDLWMLLIRQWQAVMPDISNDDTTAGSFDAGTWSLNSSEFISWMWCLSESRESRSERCCCSSQSSPLNCCLYATQLEDWAPLERAVVARVRLTPKLSSRQLPRCIYERRERDTQPTNNFHPITLAEPAAVPSRRLAAAQIVTQSVAVNSNATSPSTQFDDKLLGGGERPRISEHATTAHYSAVWRHARISYTATAAASAAATLGRFAPEVDLTGEQRLDHVDNLTCSRTRP